MRILLAALLTGSLLFGPAAEAVPHRTGNLLIVAPTGFNGSAPLQQFVAAKTAQGLTVSVYVVPPDTTTSIREHIVALRGVAEEIHDWVIDNYFVPRGYEGIKIYVAQGGDTADVTSAVNRGCLWSVYVGHSDPTGGATGTNVYGVNLNGNSSTVAGGPYYLTTGPINLTDAVSDVTLRFKCWLNTDVPPDAQAGVQINKGDGVWRAI
jgi:hypothetical protein